MSTDYRAVLADLNAQLGPDAATDDPVRRFAWSTDGSYFRIVPEIVVHANSVEEVVTTLAIARQHKAPVTFRAAGTSLSGQAVGEGILLKLGYDGFRRIDIGESTISLGSAVIGAEANAKLKPLDKKIGPDPATLASAMVGGIVANNASGMCCGTHQNSYQTIKSAKLVFADGTRLDTGKASDRDDFKESHGDLLKAIKHMAEKVQANQALTDRIKQKFAIKNTTGYSLNALVDFTCPFDVINHLVVGSEGTLAFLEEVTYHTVDEARVKGSAMAVFKSMVDAASAIPPLKIPAVSAAELLDWASIKAVMGKPGMPEWLNELPEGAAILLIECRANEKTTMDDYTQQAIDAIKHIETLRPIEFSTEPFVYSKYWAMRSGLFPIIGGERPKGTSVIIEDVAFRVEHLASAAADLSDLFTKHGYPEGVIYGHALDGNFHFIITPKFDSQADIDQFDRFMQDVAELVINKYDGSMKAEHGTGRAVAPFVEMEWGVEAYELMKEIKAVFDPDGLLNPGVILNDDTEVHIKNIKQAAVVDDWVDRCIECGFCEKTCPTSALNMSPRHRITTLREIARLEQTGSKAEAEDMRQKAQYDVIDTCVACQLCTIACPVDNNMGMLVRQLRGEQLSTTAQKVLDFQADHFGKVNTVLSTGFNFLSGMQKFTGNTVTGSVMKVGQAITKEVPYWDPDFPKGANLPRSMRGIGADRPQIVYFAACGGRTFGPTPKDPDDTTLPDVMMTLLERAGYDVVIPDNTRHLCCGQMWESKGDYKNADGKRSELVNTLAELTNGGEIPVLCDALSCTKRTLQDAEIPFQLIDAVDLIHDELLPKLNVTHKKDRVALHIGCTATHMQAGNRMQAIAKQLAENVVKPEGIICCGFAGEKGLYKPEINESALRHLKARLDGSNEGYYANRMCEIGLTRHSGISYRHLAYLVEECTRP